MFIGVSDGKIYIKISFFHRTVRYREHFSQKCAKCFLGRNDIKRYWNVHRARWKRDSIFIGNTDIGHNGRWEMSTISSDIGRCRKTSTACLSRLNVTWPYVTAAPRPFFPKQNGWITVSLFWWFTQHKTTVLLEDMSRICRGTPGIEILYFNPIKTIFDGEKLKFITVFFFVLPISVLKGLKLKCSFVTISVWHKFRG